MFALGIAAIWMTFYNTRFWDLTLNAMWRPQGDSALFMVSLLVLTLTAHALLILLWPTRLLMRIATSVLFVIAASSSHFSNEYGALMNKDMMRNVLQTDVAEASALMNAETIVHVVVLGLIPALLVWKVRLPKIRWKTQVLQRAIFLAIASTLCVAGLFASSAEYATFFRAHKPVRFTLSPAAASVSMVGVLSAGTTKSANQTLLNPAGASIRTAEITAKPLVLFLVVGETARTQNFQLAGYSRPTNPELSQIPNLTFFSKATACGTSTAISVPCLFSHLRRDDFKVDEAGRYANLLDALSQAGLDVEWRDNNSGCKGVCARVASVDYTAAANPAWCTEDNCYDEVMLTDLPAKLQALTRDTVIVFHMKGSHGPSYFERYPLSFEKFAPACRSNQLQECAPQEIVNVYDNTIAYTDYVLEKQIRLLREASDRVDGMLMYVSDHGESLGENGIYLHGMPYSFAPAGQKEVPLLMWMSDGFVARTQIQPDCLRAEANTSVSHDNFYHTALGAAGVRNQVYNRNLDLISGCRRGHGGE